MQPCSWILLFLYFYLLDTTLDVYFHCRSTLHRVLPPRQERYSVKTLLLSSVTSDQKEILKPLILIPLASPSLLCFCSLTLLVVIAFLTGTFHFILLGRLLYRSELWLFGWVLRNLLQWEKSSEVIYLLPNSPSYEAMLFHIIFYSAGSLSIHFLKLKNWKLNSPTKSHVHSLLS